MAPRSPGGRVTVAGNLSAEDVEAVARRTVELLRGEPTSVFALVDARELAALLGVSVDYVYAHATQLGAVRLGTGRRARIRFDAHSARRALEASRRVPPARGRKDDARRR